MSRHRIPILISLLVLWGCSSDDPTKPGSDLAGFNVQAPATAPAGIPFEVTVTAVGTDGADPYTDWSGNVQLSVGGGSITPHQLILADGTGSGNVTVNVVGSDIEIRAEASGKLGSALLTLTAPDSIAGNGDDPVGPNIPDLLFQAREADYAPDPALGGFLSSTNTVVLQFTPATTVAQANTVLRSAQASIAGGVPGVGAFDGIVFLRLPTADHAGLRSATAALETDPAVKVVAPDALLAPLAVPANENPAQGWDDWDTDYRGGNWGAELMRVPQMWNFNQAIEKLYNLDVYSPGNGAVTTGILDVGFYDHSDLNYSHNLTPRLVDEHGTHIAGIIAAKWSNKSGVEGLNPFTSLVVMGVPSRGSSVISIRPSWGEHQINGLRRLSVEHPEISVISMSLGYTWYLTGIDPAMNLQAQQIVQNQGVILQSVMQLLATGGPLPLIAVSAGNDAGSSLGEVEAKWNSPACYAGLELGVQNIIVVEAVGLNPGGLGNAIRWEEATSGSNVNGHISAPGDGILSTVIPDYDSKSGTSMATPHVAAVAGYLRALEPSLSAAELKNILIASAVPVQDASPMVDAFAAALEIDVFRGNDDILRKLCDIDDGSPDGNMRVDLSLQQGTVPNTDEDIDGDGGIGDGRIDMSDFRRWRDWNLIRDDDADDMDLVNHPKNDMNRNGDYFEDYIDENTFPRGDFNGDGEIDGFTSKAFVPGIINAELSDLEVLMRLWEDPVVPASDLEAIQKNSGDLDVWPREFLGIAGAVTVSSSIYIPGTQTPLHTRMHTGGGPQNEPRQVYTLPRSEDGYLARVDAKDAQGEVLDVSEKLFDPFRRGADYFFDPPPNEIKVEVTFPNGVDPEQSREVRIRAGFKQGLNVSWAQGLEVTLAVHGGTLGSISGVTDADGYFSTSVIVGHRSPTVRVEAEGRDPNTVKKGTGFGTATWAAFFFGFDADLEGWSDSTTTNGWGWVKWKSRNGPDDKRGYIELDGTGGESDPNAWIYKEFALPAGVSKITYDTAGHDQRNGDSDFRIRIEDGGQSTTVHDWESTSGGADGDYNWVTFTDNISQFAGRTVTIFFEQNDNGPGSDEQRHFDNISIR